MNHLGLPHPQNPSLSPDTPVRHAKHGKGQVLADRGTTTVVSFPTGIEEVLRTELSVALSLSSVAAQGAWNDALRVVSRAQAAAILSVNDMWGAFSRSRIDLLPHQLWVCRRVLASWPTRWLVADDVGLGKTIEAGLILSPLLSQNKVRRLLILCPASLVEQWQYRMRTMFDIRLSVYSPDADTSRTDFWGTHNLVIAKLETLRLDSRGRHERLLEADSWDLLVVDEAHRLNADEEKGPTLGYRLVQQLSDAGRLRSMVFFTGTPHRGKNYGFLSLLKLLRPDDFDPRLGLAVHLPKLRDVMIRNNKQDVTDLLGKRLFITPKVESTTYQYSQEEDRFYSMLTDFIESGQAYASKLNSTHGRAVMLVLISMQKLASSSVAAIRRALLGRLARTGEDARRLEKLKKKRYTLEGFRENYEEAERIGDLEAARNLDESVAELTDRVALMRDERERLEELVASADDVKVETKIQRILAAVEGCFAERTVLFFTEYKATQSLLMSTLMQRFGDECVTFINGDERADEVIGRSGIARTLTERRESAAQKFNEGKVRFLVSTEAGGEGIDLQENCHTLVHVDLPWNPMRLHQRVGRLNRYGQTRQVEVLTLRNPETVEARIWDTLNEKLLQIQQAFAGVMEEPEDIMQLVLGMTSPTLFRELFSEGQRVPSDSFKVWFDRKTSQFGGQDAVDTVKSMIGNCARFNFQQVSNQLPKVDLPDLRAFFISMLTINRRRLRDDSEGLSFLTPEAWKPEFGVRPEYESMAFDRQLRGPDAAKRLLGVGHKLVDLALAQACNFDDVLASIPEDVLPFPIIVYRVSDRVTDGTDIVRAMTVAVEFRANPVIVRDWELLKRLNEVASSRLKSGEPSQRPDQYLDLTSLTLIGEEIVQNTVNQLGVTFRVPEVIPLLAIVPTQAVTKTSTVCSK